MNFVKALFVSPEINPSNRKALSVPLLNPFDQYGRVFFFSWLGFMVAFLSWYAFPPLVSDIPKFYYIIMTTLPDTLTVDRYNPRRPTYDPISGRKLEHCCSSCNVRLSYGPF